LDLPGHGESSHTPGHYHLDEVADVVAAVIRTLIVRSAVVFGHSFGGAVALVLAGSHPSLVRAVIVGDHPLSRAPLRAQIDRNRSMLTRWRGLASSGASVADIAESLRHIPIVVPGRATAMPAGEVFGSDDPWFVEMARNLAAHDPEFLTAILDDLDGTHAALDPQVLLPRIRGPMLLLQGDPEVGGVLDDSDVDMARRLSPNVSVVRLDGIGHYLDPNATWPAIETFVDSLGPADCH
jgi:N-formylmaleamate deformylase